MTEEMCIRFWGVRGSYPVPGPSTLMFGGNTPCLEIEVAGQIIILDAGSGIIGLGHDLMRRYKDSRKPLVATMLFSHMHHDHTQGFPFFVPAYVGSSHLSMFGPSIFEKDLEEILARTMLPPNFPLGLTDLPSFKEISTIRETDIIMINPDTGEAKLYNRFHTKDLPATDQKITISTLRSYAHPDGVFIYRIEWNGKSVVYATDTEGYVNVDQRLAAFAKGADVLIHDAQYSEAHYIGKQPGKAAAQGWGHSTPQMACAVAHTAGVKQLVLFHHDPLNNDQAVGAMQQEAQVIFPNTVAACEGLEIHINDTIELRMPEHVVQATQTGRSPAHN